MAGESLGNILWDNIPEISQDSHDIKIITIKTITQWNGIWNGEKAKKNKNDLKVFVAYFSIFMEKGCLHKHWKDKFAQMETWL